MAYEKDAAGPAEENASNLRISLFDYFLYSPALIDHNVVLDGYHRREWNEHKSAILPILDAIELPVRPDSHVLQLAGLDIKGEIIEPP